MKYVTLALLLLAGSTLAQDDRSLDPAKLLNDLTVANAAKDAGAVGNLIDPIIQYAKTAKDTKLIDPIAKELTVSYKIAKGNWGTMRKILEAMGELRSKKALGTLKKIAYQKKARDEEHEKLQIHAVTAIAAYGDPRQINPLMELTKRQSTKIAVAAYAGFKNYGIAKGKYRKRVAEELMKRLESENPYTISPKSSTNIGGEAIKRWNKVQQPIVASLQAVCHESTINDLANWREWWKENKKNARVWKDKKTP